MDDARAERLGRNQDVVRSLNGQLDGGLITPKPPFPADVTAFLCECSDLDCTALVYVGVAKYQAVRSDPRRFFVRPGHEIPEIEDVVETGKGYAVVQKIGPAAAAASRATS